MLIVLLSAVSAASSVRVALDDQYYNKLAVEAAEAGQARAEACLAANNYTATWTDSARLRPDTTCTGASISGGNRYVAQDGNVRTTFIVWAPTTGAGASAKVTVVGTTELTRSSTSSVYQTYSQTLVRQSNYADTPQLAGGAGWKGSGHLAAVLTSSHQLYGFGGNTNGQINDAQSPASVLLPTQMLLPAGVSSISGVATSGQGGSFICVMANTAQVWCRGAASSPAVMPTTVGWYRFNLPAGLTAVSMTVSGYGQDVICVLASDEQGYCAGQNYFGSLGINDATNSIYQLTNPQKFRLDIPAPGAKLRKIVAQSDIVCGITTTNNMYCSGLNGSGEIGGAVITRVSDGGYGVYSTPIRYPIPGARTIDDVLINYHTITGHGVVHVLATDGTIWSSGDYVNGDLGNGTTAGSTGSSQTPVLFTHATNKAWATGSELWNAQSGRCVDNDANLSGNGNKIQIWDCSATPNSGPQGWVYNKDKQLTNLGTGKCLDVPANSSTPGTALQLYDCNLISGAQQFDLIGTDTIKHISSGLCVDIVSGGTANGTRLQTWTCGAGNAAQSFTRWPSINGWRGMISGTNHFCGIRSDSWSGMWCAGKNNYGQLLNDATAIGGGSFMGSCVDAPSGGHNIFNVNLPGGEKVDYTKLSSEWNQQFLSTMVITTTGKVFGAGRNEFGKLGDGTIGTGTDFAECGTTQFILPAGVTAVDMSTHDEYTTYVLGSDKRIYAAGRNTLGEVGDGTTTNRLSPVEVKVPRQATLY
jgi:alpha-tubulin suppressor-like RCC1 family protein